MAVNGIELFLCAALVLAGVVHLLPVTGVLSARRLQALYGVDASDAVTRLLLRHRALLFGVLGVGFLVAAVTPTWRVGASVVALFSMLSFVVLARGVDSSAIRRVVIVDLVLSAVLVAALVLRLANDH